ncbi:MAG: TolC family protein [Fibromonadaceae bacterium]|jgi:outer membrane protein|nr:TolC family protein [Fibromonadaceae bacterium]
MLLRLIALSLLLACEIFAQRYEDLTLQNCIEIAKKNSLSLASAKLSEKTAESALGQARYAARLPDLRGNISQSVAGSPLLEDSKKRYALGVGISSSMPIFTGGKIYHSVNRAEHNKEIATLNSDAAERNLSEQVIRTYIQVWSLIESEISAKASLALSKRLLARDSILLKAGSTTSIDIALAFAQVASDSLNLLQTQSNLTQSYTALRQLLEIPQNSSFSVSPPDSAKSETTENYATLLESAQKNSIDKKIDSLSVLAAKEAVGIAKSAYYPSVSLSGSLSSGFHWEIDDPRYQKQLKNGLGYSASLGISIPIIDWGAATDGVLQAQVSEERAQISALNTQKQLENTIEQLALQVETYRLQWEVSTIQMEAQKLSLERSVHQHELGMLDISSLVQQQTIFNSSQVKHNQAKYSYLLGNLLLDLYTGNISR